MKLCDFCKERPATLTDKTVVNNTTVEYSFCKECYFAIMKSSRTPYSVMRELEARRGKECPACGATADDFSSSFLFGCPDCYLNMRDIAVSSALACQSGAMHVGKTPDGRNPVFGENDADTEFTRFNVVSSRVRLARNVRGVAFPHNPEKMDEDKRLLLPSAVNAALKGTFDYNFFYLRDTSDLQKKALVERHLISPALVKNSGESAALIEKSEGISVMVNEEDHLREQCVSDGFDLFGAYRRVNAVDDVLLRKLPIAYDSELGFLTACPTNLGTGMRASVMLFLPALRLANAIEDAILVYKRDFGLTIRGVYGEGSGALGDMYQLSNTRTLGLPERALIDEVSRAAEGMCRAEAAARNKLVRECGVELKDRIFRSFGTLTSAYSLSSEELLSLISDAKLGVILGLLPLKNTKALDRLYVLFSASSLMLRIGECSPSVRDVTRAKLVRDILSEVI